MNHRIARTLDQLLGPAALVLLSLTLYELGAGEAFGLLEMALVFTLALLALRFFVDPHGLLRRLLETLWSAWPLAAAFLLYLVWDAVTLFYAPDPTLVWLKYRVVLFNLFWMACLLVLSERDKLPGRIAGCFALVAAVLSVMGAAARFWPTVYPVYYTARLTLRQDYNMYAMTILFGLALGVRQLGIWAKERPRLYWLSTGLAAVALPALYLSGSRRAFLLLLVFLPLLLWDSWRSGGGRGLLHPLAGVLFAVLMIPLLQRAMVDLPPRAAAVPEGGPNGTTAAQRYETLLSGGFLGKRKLLWRVAWQEAETFTGREKILGRGNGYDIVLYDRSQDRELRETYPMLSEQTGLLSAHNLLLADYLGGGWVKLILCLLLLGTLAAGSWKLLKLRGWDALVWCLCLWTALFCDLISNRFGLLYDKFACLFAAMILLGLSLAERKGEGRP